MVLFQFKPFFQNFFVLLGRMAMKKIDVSKEIGVSGGTFSLYFFDNESIYLALHIRNLIPKPTFAALYISINVLCYALSFHLSDTLLLARLNLSLLLYGCKVRKSKSWNSFQWKQLLEHQTNEWIKTYVF